LPWGIGHTDWESQNLRWLNRELHVTHDWHSLASRPEATIAGMASIMFPSSGTLNEQATNIYLMESHRLFASLPKTA
jgi:uncharacterized SAM-binding protein YcdF (DUF218 family)